MATYDMFKLQATPSASPQAGRSVLMRGDIDFLGMVQLGKSVTSSDVLRLIPLRDQWIIVNSWYRVKTASTDSSTRTVDIGTADNGTQIASNVDMKTAGDWVQGTIGSDTGGGTGTHVIATNQVSGAPDDYIYVSPDHDYTDGILQVMIEVVATPGSET